MRGAWQPAIVRVRWIPADQANGQIEGAQSMQLSAGISDSSTFWPLVSPIS